jgi:hypothetical protein
MELYYMLAYLHPDQFDNQDHANHIDNTNQQHPKLQDVKRIELNYQKKSYLFQ